MTHRTLYPTATAELVAWSIRASNATPEWSPAQLVEAWQNEGLRDEVPNNNWRPGQAARCRRPVATTIANASAILAGQARRSDVDLSDLGHLLKARDEVDTALTTMVGNLRRQGYSWNDIAGATGKSKANAIQRWNAKVLALFTREGIALEPVA
jgi:hypothetical protein